MPPAYLLFIASALLAPNSPHAGWTYPNAVQSGTSESSFGMNMWSYSGKTDDNPEKVILFYTKMMGLKKDHPLVTQAITGFIKIQIEQHINHGLGSNTNGNKLGILTTARLSKDFAHVQIVYSPEFKPANSITISITQIPTGTSIIITALKQSE